MIMKRILFAVTMMLVLATSSLYAQKTHDQLEFPEINQFQMPDVTTFELNNGIKFYLVENNELPLISVSALIRAGSFMDPADKIGLASLTGDLIRSGGSTNWPYEQLNAFLESKAASVETSFGLTSGRAAMNILKEDFDEMLPIFLDVIRNPAFPDNRIDVSKTQLRSSITRRNDNAGAVASREFYNLIYGKESVYARTIELAHVDAITKEDMQQFHRRVMVGQNMMISVIGDFDSAEMRTKLEQAFNSIPAGTANELNLPDINYEFESNVNFVAKNDVNQSNIFIGHIGGLRSNPDYSSLQLMNEILSGGFSGRLLQVIRTDLGLAYDAGGAYISNPLYEGPFYVTLSTASANTADAVAATKNEIQRMYQDGVTQSELDAAKDRILNTLVFRYTSRAAVLNERVSNEYFGLPADAFNKYIAEVQSATVEQVNQAAREYLRPDALKVLIVGNENEMGDQLESLGDVNVIDITIPRPEVVRSEPAGDTETGRKYLNQMTSALLPGGKDSNTVVYNGVIAVSGMNIDAKITMTFPGRLIQELNTAQGLITVAYENGTGVMRMGPNQQQLPAAQVEGLENELNRHYLAVAFGSDDTSVEFTGMDENGLAMLFFPDLDMTIYLNTETGFPAKLIVKEFNQTAGQEMESVTTFADWTESGGVNMAYTAEMTVNGNPAGKATITSHSVE
ncbi:MAG TPA: hypothetical protein DCE78_08930 [Bacteroidetes bacterium]|nr:hypothetical protein [Bacteroidota bacterium]